MAIVWNWPMTMKKAPQKIAMITEQMKYDMLEEWSKTKRAPQHTHFLHADELSHILSYRQSRRLSLAEVVLMVNALEASSTMIKNAKQLRLLFLISIDRVSILISYSELALKSPINHQIIAFHLLHGEFYFRPPPYRIKSNCSCMKPVYASPLNLYVLASQVGSNLISRSSCCSGHSN